MSNGAIVVFDALIIANLLALALLMPMAHPEPRQCYPIDRVLIDGEVFVGTWWIERQEGSSVAVLRIERRR